MENIPWKTKEIVNFIYPWRFSEEEIQNNLPAIPEAWYEVGRKLQRGGQQEKAIPYFMQSIEIAGNDEAKPEYFSHLYQLYKRLKDETKAIETLQLGIKRLPDYAPFRTWMGDYYLENDIPYRAREEYSQALRLDPRNVRIKKKLEELDQD